MRSIEMAQQLLEEKRSDLHPFLLHTNNVEDIGMICGGDVTAFFQYIPADDPMWQEICSKALELFSAQKAGWFVQQLDGGIPAILDENGTLMAGEKPEDGFPKGSSPVLTGSAFWMPLPVAQRVIIFGGGHIAASLVPLLTTVGFRCWVYDNRPEYTAADRFPQDLHPGPSCCMPEAQEP